MKSPSASVIDGVFCWFDDSLQITVYDHSIHKCFWALKLPEDMETGKANTVLQCPEDFGLEGYNPPPIGFICKVDNPDNKDIISFTIVRYAIPARPQFDLQVAVTIESFSSETNVWTANKIILDVPIRLFPCTLTKSPSASVIDGVFCWYDDSLQITVYDSIHKSFWDLKLPEDMERGIGCGYLGSSAGGLYFALNIIFKGTVIVWYLASNIRSRDAVWVKKYVGNVRSTVLQCPEDFGVEGYPHIELNNMVIHPTVPHIFYLGLQRNIISYDFEMDVAQLVNNFSGCPTMKRYKLFPFEWYLEVFMVWIKIDSNR
ncbi:hypothetical protein MTR67_053407 [Solanum verrucosum]|uniref:F-box protein n=1 Tax=Solanum verrucosum TaxID=315347 RepID=A0AAF0V7Y9_SOLVR|nr:hypothetical protein MTR67_053407 [Solanum verrucosum]